MAFLEVKNLTRIYGKKENALVALDHVSFAVDKGEFIAVTGASGQALNESTNNSVKKSKMVQGYLEGSNVQVATEMVNLIVAQRAYEMNSKAITTTDEMMQTANNLKR